MSTEDTQASRIDHSTPARKLIWTEPRTFFGVPAVGDLDGSMSQS
jgi:hypothetical protein